MSLIDDAARAEWRSAIGRRVEQHQCLEAESLRRFALAIGEDADIERRQPSLAHWAFFLPDPRDEDIVEDGHPRRGGFLPAITLPRRMFAAGTMQFKAPLDIGQEATLASTVIDVAFKHGKSGDLVFVEVERILAQQGLVRVEERQSYVYRDMGDPTPMPVPDPARPSGEEWRPSEPNLFRFSAATFNSHRIHYDLPYAREVEGYPALVVHGPFTAARLAGLAGREGGLREFSFRAQAPLFLGQSIWLDGGAGEVRAVRCDGATAMTATYRLGGFDD